MKTKAYYKILDSLKKTKTIEQMHSTRKWINFFYRIYKDYYLLNLLLNEYYKKAEDKIFVWF